MKKIIFVTGGLISGGAERVLSLVSSGLCKRGYIVSIISKQKLEPFYELDSNVRLIFPNHKINYNNFFMKFLTRLEVYLDLYKIIKEESPDVIIPFSTSNNAITIVIAFLLRKKVIASEHNNYKVGLNKFHIWFTKRILYKFTDALLVLTKRDLNDYYSRFIKNVVVMPNPLSLVSVERKIFHQEEIIILAVGNVSRWYHKGFDNLLKIFHEVQKKVPKAKLQIVGGGDSTYLKNLSIKLGIVNKVEFISQVRNIRDYYQSATIFVLSSRWEGLPMVLIEAMSQGLPSVAYNCFSGPAEIIEDNFDGILVADQHKLKFANEIVDLLNNKSKMENLSINAIEKSKTFDLENVLDKWENLLHHI